MRPWIAVVAAYALALQVLLTGLAAGHLAAAGDAAASDPFVICHGGGSPDGQNPPEQPPFACSSCVLCTLMQAPWAILPAEHGIVTIAAMSAARVVPPHDARIIEFNSPTGRYQRGPPAAGAISG